MHRTRPTTLYAMRNSWTRAWLAALASIVLAVVVSTSREEWLLRVEKPVMDWLLEGPQATVWDRAEILSSWAIIIPGTLILAAITVRKEVRVAIAIVATTLFAYAMAGVLSSIVGRVGPLGESTGTFPSFEVVRAAVFFGLIVLTAWWVGAPKLLWHVLLELATVLSLIVSIRLIAAGEVWPSDAIAAAMVATLSLITAAILFESNPAPLKARSESGGGLTSKFKKQTNERATAA